jgi:hypothetical protein
MLALVVVVVERESTSFDSTVCYTFCGLHSALSLSLFLSHTHLCFFFLLSLTLTKSVIKTVDVSYGGESGFNQAIELSAETLGSVKLVNI